MNRKVYILIFLLALSLSGAAHTPEKNRDTPFKIKRAALWFGMRNLQVETLPASTELDFLNFANNYIWNEYFILGISLQLQGRGPFIVSLDAFTSDDIIPNSFRLDFQYNLNPWLGLNAGFMQYPFLVTGYGDYFAELDAGFYTDGGQYANLRQKTLHDFVLTAGPSLHLNGKAGFVSLWLNLAYGSLLPFSQSFYQKKINSNNRREIIYKASPSSAFFLFPQIIFGKDISNFSGSKLGVQLKASTYAGSRSINYSRSIREWTEENVSHQQISNPLHNFRKTDISLGIYWRF